MQRNGPLRARRFAAPWLTRHAQRGERRPLWATRRWPDRILLAGSCPGFARLERHALGASLLADRSPSDPFRGPTRKEEKK
jgi:hypothetical protein